MAQGIKNLLHCQRPGFDPWVRKSPWKREWQPILTIIRKVWIVQSLSHVRLFVTAAHQASLSISSSQSLFKLMSIKSVMASNHLILCHPLLLPSIFPIIRVFSNESVLHIRWPKYWSFNFSISPSNEYS